jgi:hypothetical protein
VKKSAWIRRRSEVLTEAFDMGECDPIKIEEYNNFSDPQTKYLVYRVWMRHLHLRLYRSLAYIGTRLRELEMIPYMVQTYA